MKHYAFIKDGKFIGVGQAKTLDNDINNVEITKEFFDECVSEPKKYSYSDGKFVLNPNFIDELKTAKLAEVDQWTASKITGGFLSGGVRYDSDMDTQTTMQGIALNVNTERFATDYPHGIPVRGYDEGATEKTIHYLTSEEVLMFCADLSEHIGRCKLDGWTMQQAVLEASSKEELDNIQLD